MVDWRPELRLQVLVEEYSTEELEVGAVYLGRKGFASGQTVLRDQRKAVARIDRLQGRPKKDVVEDHLEEPSSLIGSVGEE